MALVTYNLLSVVRAAVRGVYGEEAANKLSTHYLAHAVASTHLGMSTVLGGAFWATEYASLTPTQLANELLPMARNMRLNKYKKATTRPKKKGAKKMNKKERSHISTARVLQESRG